MTDQPAGTLVRLEDAGLTLDNPADDVRGRKVLDGSGEELGKVEGLLIDEGERRVRFLDVGSGGILGLGELHRLIPVEAISRIADDAVVISKDRDHVASSPGYDPEVVPNPPYYEEVYQYWGYPPYWR